MQNGQNLSILPILMILLSHNITIQLQLIYYPTPAYGRRRGPVIYSFVDIVPTMGI